ncbi:hypothetical protein BN14_06256 [Rhizoctonia solani AG-1 IB]|uniref:Uncharacterized protein n=2 Tax=Rhizoctonia solani TaxID=456999 RepID=A0A8H2WE93_9AGAM|nr:unnamed protein product [Rhizoctonia solani]CCO32202.1 hypothetical protein BN14_06256 [Rhizoctonia solani AG-1 IB]
MNFRYDTTTLPEVEEPIFNLTKGLGVRWAYGVPDKLVILLARMNGLLEDFGSNVDPLTIKQLEMEIEAIEAFVVPSADHNLDVGILAVQECWRQAAYIYLYMGLCGADSHDPRVVRTHGKFIEVFTRTKPGRMPDSFLILALPILGIATRHPDEQELLKRRMMALPECSRRGASGNQLIQMLEAIWSLANESGRSMTWSDLRLVSLYVAGV